MSVKAINWALELELAPAKKLVLVVIADYADENGYAFPGADRIAARASVSPRQLTRILSDLEDEGLLERERRHLMNGNRTSDGYRLLPLTRSQNGALTRRHLEQDKTPTVASTGEPSVEPPVPTKKRARPMPEDWAPHAAHRDKARTLVIDADVEAMKFRDWVAANGKLYVDWDAAFHTWLNRAGPGSRPARPARRTTTDRMQEVLAIPDPRAGHETRELER